MVLETTLKDYIELHFPEHADKIIECIQTQLNRNIAGKELQDAIIECFNEKIPMNERTVTEKAHLEKIPRGHVHIGG